MKMPEDRKRTEQNQSGESVRRTEQNQPEESVGKAECGKLLWHKLLEFWQKWKRPKGSSPGEKTKVEDEPQLPWKNPYIPLFKDILLQILEQKGISYRDFKPVLLDRDIEKDDAKDTENNWSLSKDNISWDSREKADGLSSDEMDEDIKEILAQISEDLNYLRIYTDRPEYFYRYTGTMYEENGLLVELLPKGKNCFYPEEFVIDAEQQKLPAPKYWEDAFAWLPVWKKPWKPAGNLDIAVPIGYNTLIVKGLNNAAECSGQIFD